MLIRWICCEGSKSPSAALKFEVFSLRRASVFVVRSCWLVVLGIGLNCLCAQLERHRRVLRSNSWCEQRRERLPIAPSQFERKTGPKSGDFEKISECSTLRTQA